jgi:hypothetical protein
MKPLCLFTLGLLLGGPAFAQDTFPGLNAILTAEEKKRAGLSRFSPDELGVIDAALIRYYMRVVTGLPGVAPTPAPEAAPAAEPGFWDRFGLTKLTDADWKKQTPLIAKVTGWQGGNRFALDNGQVWEGVDTIPYEIAGKPVTIEARPLGNFALKLDDKSAVVRVRRVK